MPLSKVLLVFLILISCKSYSYAQIPDSALVNLKTKFATEKIFIHFDKQSYVAGETIWFKAYLLSGFLPSFLSTALNVDLVNDSGRIIDRKILPITNSTASGNFILSKDAPQMNYTIRAYTRRLMNFGKDFFYYQQLPVFNPASLKETRTPEKELSLYFLPELGNMIGGIKNIIAFKCTDQWGYPAEAEGTLVNEAGATLATFASIHDGMGKFEFTPVNGEKYTAVCTLAKTEHKKVPLPVATAAGTSLSIQKMDGKTYFLINSETVFNATMQPAYILAVMEDMVIFKTMLPEGQKNFKGQIPVSEIASGILQVTLFTKEHKPLAERLIFIHNKDHVAPGIFNLDTSSTADRAKNVYSFELQDSLNGSFSVSVTDVNKEFKLNGRDNIISRFLLTNDIKGYVHNPAYYFENDVEERKYHLDLVMLTNGWRKFKWNEILGARLPLITYDDPNYVSLKGIAYKAENNNPLGETNLTFFIKTKDSVNDMMIVPVEKDGSFEIKGLIFNDTATFYVQNMDPKNKRVNIQLTNLPLSGTLNIAKPTFSLPVKPLSISEDLPAIKKQYSTLLENLDRNAILLQEITVKSKVKTPIRLLEDRYVRNGVFNAYATKTLDLLNDKSTTNNATNIFEYLKGRLSSVNISGSGGNYFVNFRNSLSLSGGLIPMALFLDENPAQSIQISTIPVSQIAMVKVYPTGFVGAEGSGPGGALAIYTKKGDDTYNVPGMDFMHRLKVEGYSPVKEFFSPDYSEGTAGTQFDSRSTLYWDPNLQTDPANKKIRMSFYNADNVKKMRIVLEGMTEEGKLVHIEKIVE